MLNQAFRTPARLTEPPKFHNSSPPTAFAIHRNSDFSGESAGVELSTVRLHSRSAREEAVLTFQHLTSGTSSMLVTLFWLSLAAVAMTYVIYPLLLAALPSKRRQPADASYQPPVSLIISAYNEAQIIREKLENALALDYPTDLLEMIVISDGSTDGTDEIVSGYASRGVLLRRQEPRGGKSLGLTRFVPFASGKILIFSDANSIYRPDAIQNLVRHFADPSVGYVVGHQNYLSSGSAATISETLYWRYESYVKGQESRVGCVVGGDGAIGAMRAELFEPLRADDINDFYLPLRIVARGYIGVFDKDAICYEHTAAGFRGEFRRKVRIVTRSLRAVGRVAETLNPVQVGFFAVQLFVHKIVRWFVPFFLMGMFVSSAALAERGLVPYRVMLQLQTVFYLLALLGFIPIALRMRPISFAFYFCVVNAAAFLGIVNCIFGRRISTWQPERAPLDNPVPSAEA